ncbi:MAG: methylmalonyl-CoA epimerase, partial [Flavobacteriaceae bacterium]|nr:methylmalonyl-CoA epimerase [Flavobacteriaceae bacterium]
MKRIEHIGIAVENLDQSIDLYTKLLNVECYKTEEVASEKVITAFFKSADQKIELLASTDPEGPIAKFLAKKGPGLHHIAFAVEDIYVEIDRLKSQGFVFVSEIPKRGADNKWVVFLHPKSSGG